MSFEMRQYLGVTSDPMALASDGMSGNFFLGFFGTITCAAGLAFWAFPPGGVFDVATFATPLTLTTFVRATFTTSTACTCLFKCISDVLLENVCKRFARHMCVMQSPLDVA